MGRFGAVPDAAFDVDPKVPPGTVVSTSKPLLQRVRAGCLGEKASRAERYLLFQALAGEGRDWRQGMPGRVELEIASAFRAGLYSAVGLGNGGDENVGEFYGPFTAVAVSGHGAA